MVKVFTKEGVKSLDSSQLSWAIKNIYQDEKEDRERLDDLHYWMNPDLYYAIEKKKKEVKDKTKKKNLDVFIQNLIAHGADPQDLKDITDRYK